MTTDGHTSYIRSTTNPADGKAACVLRWGTITALLTPDDARAMALHWTSAAVAAQIDARLRYVLGDHPQLTPQDIEQIFAGLQSVQR